MTERTHNGLPALGLTILRVDTDAYGHANKTATKRFSEAGSRPYDLIKHWKAEPVQAQNIRALSKQLLSIEPVPTACVVRAEPIPGTDLSKSIRRLIHDNGNDAATLQPCARRWVCIDIDGVEAPEGIDPALDPGGAAEYIVKTCLPAEFAQATCHYQWSASQGIKDGLRCHLWFFLNQTVDDKTLKRYFTAIKKDYPAIDPSLFDGAHVHYVARPIFEDGRKDPLPGALRSGLLEGERDTVPLAPIETLIHDDDTAYIAGGEYKPGVGFQGFLDGIGSDRDGFHSPIRDAVSSFVGTHGPEGDWPAAKAAIRQAVAEAIARAGRGDRSEQYIREKVSDRYLDADYRQCLRKFVHTPGAQRGSQPKAERIESRLVQGVAPPEYHPVPVDEARRQLAASRAHWLADPHSPRVRVEAGDPGLGKSTTAVTDSCTFVRADRARRLEKGIEDEPRVNFYVDKIATGEELAERCTEPKIVIRGRNADNCKKYHEIQAALAKVPGLPVMAAFCKQGKARCENYEECEYIAQLQSEANIRFMAIDHAHYNRGAFGLNHAHVTAMDEEDRAAYEIKTYDLDKVVESAGDAREVIDFIETVAHADVPAVQREAGWDYDRLHDALVELVKRHRLKVSPTMSSEERSRAIKNHRPCPMVQILKTLEQEIDIPRTNGFMGVENIHGKIHVRRRRGLYTNKRSKILAMNATAKRDQAEALSPGCEFERIEVQDNLHLTQIYGSSYSERYFTTDTHAGEHIRKMQRHIDTIAHIEKVKGNGRVLFVTYLSIEDKFTMPGGCEIAHFGGLRGLNRYEDFDAVCVIGRNEPKPVAIEDQARALHFDGIEEIQTLPEGSYYPKAVRPFIMRDGSAIGIAVPCHPDTRCQSILETKREDETLQAIGRIRSINSPTQKRAYIFSEIPIRRPVDELIHKSAVDDVWTHVATMLNGVVPMVPAFLTERFPEVFQTRKAAEHAVQRLRNLNPQSPIRDTNWTMGVLNLRLSKGVRSARFRREAQRGKGSEVLTVHGTEQTRARLEEWFGSLTDFDMPEVQVEAPPEATVPDIEPVTLAEPGSTGPLAVDPAAAMDIERALARKKRLESTHEPRGLVLLFEDLVGTADPSQAARKIG